MAQELQIRFMVLKLVGKEWCFYARAVVDCKSSIIHVAKGTKDEVYYSWGAGRLTGGRVQVIFDASNRRGRAEDKLRRRTK